MAIVAPCPDEIRRRDLSTPFGPGSVEHVQFGVGCWIFRVHIAKMVFRADCRRLGEHSFARFKMEKPGCDMAGGSGEAGATCAGALSVTM
jgi:hypothetical protein